MTIYENWKETMNNDIDEALKRLGVQAESTFKAAFSNEYFGKFLFEELERDHYYFSKDETGDAVWIAPSEIDQKKYKTLKVEEEKKFPPNNLHPKPFHFWGCSYIDTNLFEDRRSKEIEKRIKKAGKSLAQRANKAFIDVLMNSATAENTYSVESENFDDLLADLFSEWLQKGYKLDRFLFPAHLAALFFKNKVIEHKSKFVSDHYVGNVTITNQDAFSSIELPKDTAIIFSHDIGTALTKELRVDVTRANLELHGPTPAICGGFGLNPIVKNIQGVIVITGLEQALRAAGGSKVPLNNLGEAKRYFDNIKDEITRSVIKDSFKEIALYDLDQAQKAFQSEAFKACVTMLGAVLEGLMLGTILRADVLTAISSSSSPPPIIQSLGLRNPNLANKIADELGFEDYKNTLKHFMPGIEALKVEGIQTFRNAIHPWKSIKEPTVYGNFDEPRAVNHLTSLTILAQYILTWTP